jgi:DNA-binding response OmpR family regulator
VKLYFPRHLSSKETVIEDVSEPEYPSAGDEVVLVVEDNPEVRAFSVMSLTELGYRVLQAADAEAALSILRTDQRVDLVFTDVVLPGQSGRVLADESAIVRPGLKVLFTTGYSRNAIVHHGRLDAGVRLLQKPFTFNQLASRIREVLDE